MRSSATSLRPTGTTGCGSRSACRWACWTRLRLPSPSQSTRRLRGRPMAVQQAIPKARTGIPGGFSGSALRADFPIFENPTGSGKRLVYLDAAASSPKPRVVIDTMADAYAHHYANVHRGIYELSEDATARFEAARRKLAAFINAPSERECVFVRNATEAINLIAYSCGRTNVDRRALGATPSSRGDAALPDRRQHDHPRHPRRRRVERGALQVRGRYAGDRRGDRAWGGHRLPDRHRHGPSARAREIPLRASLGGALRDPWGSPAGAG